MDIDTVEGGEELSIDQAAAAYVKASEPEVVTDDQAEPAPDESGTTDEELQASDEDEGEEADGEPGDEDQAEPTEDEDEPETERGRYVAHDGRVRLADGTEATVSDLIAGNLKNADATRKWQEAADLRRTAEAESAAIRASEQKINEQREYLASLIQSIIPQAPDPSLLQTDPLGYMTQKANHEQWGQHLAYLEQEQQRTQTERQASAEKEVAEKRQKEWATALEKLPELKDPQRLEAFGKDTLKYGAEYGYTPQELANIHHDHRNLVVMKKAIAWDKLQASKATVQKKVEGRPPVQRGGKRLNPSEQRARTANDATNRLKQSGRLDDAVAAYLATTKG